MSRASTSGSAALEEEFARIMECIDVEKQLAPRSRHIDVRLKAWEQRLSPVCINLGFSRSVGTVGARALVRVVFSLESRHCAHTRGDSHVPEI